MDIATQRRLLELLKNILPVVSRGLGGRGFQCSGRPEGAMAGDPGAVKLHRGSVRSFGQIVAQEGFHVASACWCHGERRFLHDERGCSRWYLPSDPRFHHLLVEGARQTHLRPCLLQGCSQVRSDIIPTPFQLLVVRLQGTMLGSSAKHRQDNWC